MKKILLIVSILLAVFTVSGRVVAGVPVASSAESRVSENRYYAPNIQSDSLARGVKSDIVQMVGNNLIYIPGVKSRRAHKDSVSVVAYKPIENDSLTLSATVGTLSERTPAARRKKYFKNVILYGAGRDRFGNFTEECAAHANGRLRKFGIYSYGHSYQIPSHFYPVVNGYAVVDLPSMKNRNGYEQVIAIMNLHRQASDYIKENFDISTLIPGEYYVVNMYYSTSPHMVEFYNAARIQRTYNYGTHVGVLYYDKKSEDWVVEHNIHGDVHRNSLRSVLGGRSNPHKYGVTTIYRASPID